MELQSEMMDEFNMGLSFAVPDGDPFYANVATPSIDCSDGSSAVTTTFDADTSSEKLKQQPQPQQQYQSDVWLTFESDVHTKCIGDSLDAIITAFPTLSNADNVPARDGLSASLTRIRLTPIAGMFCTSHPHIAVCEVKELVSFDPGVLDATSDGDDAIWDVECYIVGVSAHSSSHEASTVAANKVQSVKVNVVIRANATKVRRLLERDAPIPAHRTLADLMWKHQDKPLDFVDFSDFAKTRAGRFVSLNDDMAVNVPGAGDQEFIGQPEYLKTELCPHQVDAFRWMCHVENIISAPIIIEEEVVCDVGDHKQISVNSDGVIRVGENRKFARVRARGGIYADPRGSGKSLALLALIAAKPSVTSDDVDVGSAPAAIKRKLNEPTTSSTCTTVMTAAAATPPIDAQYRSGATLIICPTASDLKHWELMIAKHTTGKLRVTTVRSIGDLERLTYANVSKSDIVIVVKTVMERPIYYGVLKLQKGEMAIMEDSLRLRCAFNESAQRDFIKRPRLEFIRWHRVIIDKATEYPGKSSTFYRCFLKELSFDAVWCVDEKYGWDTFDDSLSVMLMDTRIVTHITGGADDEARANGSAAWSQSVDARSLSIICRQLSKLLRRFDPTAGTEALPVPVVSEEVIAVQIDPLEAAIRNLASRQCMSRDDTEAVKCNIRALEGVSDAMPSAASRPGVISVSDSFGTTWAGWLDCVKRMIAFKQIGCGKIQEQLKSATTVVSSNLALVTLANARRELAEETAHLTKFTKDVRMVCTFLPIIFGDRLAKVECPVCMSDGITSWEVRPCGHIVCSDCYPLVPESFRTRCCECKTPFDPADVSTLSVNIEDKFSRNAYLYGARMAALIDLLDREIIQNVFNQAVIYCCSPDDCDLLCNSLKEVGMDVTTLPAPAYARMTTLNKFNTGSKSRILAIDSSTSLTTFEHAVATHFVLFKEYLSPIRSYPTHETSLRLTRPPATSKCPMKFVRIVDDIDADGNARIVSPSPPE